MHVQKLFDLLPNKSIYWHDNISPTFLKSMKENLITPFTIIINQMLNTGIYPEQLKIEKL